MYTYRVFASVILVYTNGTVTFLFPMVDIIENNPKLLQNLLLTLATLYDSYTCFTSSRQLTVLFTLY
jgi:hypothetical protein